MTGYRARRAPLSLLLLGAALADGAGAQHPSAAAGAPPPRAALPTAALRFGDARLATGVRLRYAERGEAGGPVVILLHGYSDSWQSFSRVLPLLPSRLRVYALDQRGHGDSDRPMTGYRMRDLAADVVAFMDAKGIARATVVGHSMGSFVAQQVALDAPARVERLVLVGSATSVHRVAGMDELKGAVASFPDPDGPAPVEFIRAFQASTAHRPVPAAFMDSVVAASRQLPARVWRALLDGMYATPAPTARGLGARGIATLLMWGDRDAYFPRSEQEALLRRIPGARLVTYPGTGHSPHWEQPAEFARDLARFAGGARPR
jgi:pimeloyl-ACP methyl ester carboxylesterase